MCSKTHLNTKYKKLCFRKNILFYSNFMGKNITKYVLQSILVFSILPKSVRTYIIISISKYKLDHEDPEFLESARQEAARLTRLIIHHARANARSRARVHSSRGVPKLFHQQNLFLPFTYSCQPNPHPHSSHCVSETREEEEDTEEDEWIVILPEHLTDQSMQKEHDFSVTCLTWDHGTDFHM